MIQACNLYFCCAYQLYMKYNDLLMTVFRR